MVVTHFCTNRLEVTDHARAAFNKIQVGQSRCHGQLIVSDGARVRVGDVMNVGCTVESSGQVKWMTSTNLVSVRGGAALTNAEAVLVGCAPRAGIAGGVGNVLEYTGAGTTGVVLKTITPYTDNTVRVADGAVLMAAGFAFQSGGALELAGGTYTNLTDAVEVSAPGRLCGSGGAYAVAEDLTFNENVRVALTNVSVSLGHYLKLKKNAALELAGADGRLAYGKLYFDRPNAELVLRDCSTLGGRVEMTQSNSVLRLENAQVTIASSDATAIFMLGDGSGNDETNVAYERHVHIAGTNTHVRVRDVPNHGLFVRGSNTTMHVEIPAGGFSTVRPVFDLKKISWNGQFNPRLRVEITVDEKLPLNGGGTYTLFRTEDDSAQSNSIDYVYDPAVVTIDKTVAKEVRIRVKSTRGAVLIIR